MTERDRAIAALQHVRNALVAALNGASVLPALHTAEEHLLRLLFDPNEVEQYLVSDGAKVYGR